MGGPPGGADPGDPDSPVIFTETPLAGAFIVAPVPREDVRGFFARVWCEQEFTAQGLETAVAQCNMSYNRHRGTLRGMHWQTAPFEEAKLIRVTRGAIHDVIIDLRPGSPTYRAHTAALLSAANRLALYIPRGFAHGFQTLEDDTEVYYQMSQAYSPEHGRGLRWNDPAFKIAWPIVPPIILERDDSYPDFR